MSKKEWPLPSRVTSPRRLPRPTQGPVKGRTTASRLFLSDISSTLQEFTHEPDNSPYALRQREAA